MMNFDLPFKYIYSVGLDEAYFEELVNDFEINHLDIEDVLTDTQLAKVEVRRDYMYVALQFPRFDKAKRLFLEKEIHVFIGKDFLIVINKHECGTTERFQQILQATSDEFQNPLQVFYEMLDFLVTATFRAIPLFKIEIATVEKNIFSSTNNVDMIQDIQILKRNLINYNSTIIPLSILIQDMQTRYNTRLTPEGIEKLDDSLDKIKKILSSTQNFKEQMNMIADTNETLINRSTNQIIKRLTSISMLILVPNIITSFFGMNVFFGWQPEYDTWPVLAICLSILASTLVVFLVLWKKKWL
jgi:magnesium transporter